MTSAVSRKETPADNEPGKIDQMIGLVTKKVTRHWLIVGIALTAIGFLSLGAALHLPCMSSMQIDTSFRFPKELDFINGMFNTPFFNSMPIGFICITGVIGGGLYVLTKKIHEKAEDPDIKSLAKTIRNALKILIPAAMIGSFMIYFSGQYSILDGLGASTLPAIGILAISSFGLGLIVANVLKKHPKIAADVGYTAATLCALAILAYIAFSFYDTFKVPGYAHPGSFSRSVIGMICFAVVPLLFANVEEFRRRKPQQSVDFLGISKKKPKKKPHQEIEMRRLNSSL